jgi:hypothetical protein
MNYKFAISGAAAGAANGLFGAGGGMILVPLLTRWAGMPSKDAFASSISIILPMCLVSLGVYVSQGQLDVSTALPYLLGGFAGGLLGGKLFGQVPDKLLHRGLGLFVIYGGLRSLIC